MTKHERMGLFAILFLAFGAGCSDDDDARPKDTSDAGGAAGSEGSAEGGRSTNAGGGAAGASEHTGGKAGSSGKTSGEGGAEERGGTAGSAEEPGGEGGSAETGGSAGSQDQSGGDGNTPYGFTIREPEARNVTCSQGPDGLPMTEPSLMNDEDYVCTFVHGSVAGHVTVQATPTDCVQFMAPVPTSFETAGWISIDGEVSPLEGLTYDHGGNHFNNAFEFDYAGNRYRFWHSSIGFGGRACQPPDCLQVFEPGAAEPTEDGCTSERTLPVVCALVESGPVVPSLEDTFAPCPGDEGATGDADATRSGSTETQR